MKRLAFLFCLVIAILSIQATARSHGYYTWSGGSSGSWADSTKWTPTRATPTVLLTGVNALSRWFPALLLPGEYSADANTLLLAHLDETAGSTINDVSGNNNTGTASGTTIVNGRFGKARNFDGIADYVEGTSSSFNLGSSSFTVEAGVRTSSSSGQAIFTTHHTVASKYSNIGLYIAGGTGNGFSDIDINNGQGSSTNWNGRRINDGIWHHIAAVRNSNYAYLYVDGVLDFVDTLTQNPEASNIYRLGSTYPGSYFEGALDEIRVSNIARSPQEFGIQLRPKNLVATATSASITLTWQNGGGAAPLMRYRIYRGTDSSSVAVYDSTAMLSYVDAAPTVGTVHFYRVAAVDSTEFESVKSYSSSASVSAVPPTLTTVSPQFGAVGETLVVTLTGTNFTSGTSSVSFSGTGITVNSVTFTSSTQLTANISIAAGAATGLRNVSVTTPGGTATKTNAFEVGRPTPVLTSVSPATGGRGQSLSVFLNGTGFVNGVTTASLGNGITVASVDGSSTSLTAQIVISQSAALGPRDVTVSTAAPGGGESTLTGAFSVVNPVPTITSISPTSGTRGKSLNVVVTGTDYYSGVTSLSLGNGITVDSVVVLSNTQLQARLSIAYDASGGARDVSVTNAAPGGGSATLTGSFTVNNPVPKITAVSPVVAPRGKSTTMTITGTDFVTGVTGVSAGTGITAGSVTVVSSTQLTASLSISRSATLGARDLTVTNGAPGGGTGTLAGGFNVQNPAPNASSVSPQSGILGQSLSVVVTGSDFYSGVTGADFGAGITVNSTTIDTAGTHLTANLTISSAAAVGSRTITLTNSAPGGGSVALTSAFVVNNPAPTLTSVSPALGGKGQTLNVSLVGTNFIAGVTTVEFGLGITVGSVTVNSPTSLTANISIDANTIAAARSVSVTNAPPGGGKATLTFVFNVVNLAPTIANVSPATGSRGETVTVTLTGTNFSSGSTTVVFGSGITVGSVAVASPTQLTVNLTIATGAALGARNIGATNPPPGGGTATLTNGFMVGNPAPTVSAVAPASGSRGQSLTVNVTGTGFFSGATTVSFGPNIDVTSINVLSPTQLTANITVTSGAATGARSVQVTNPAPGGGTVGLTGGFTVTNPAPTIVGIAPNTVVRGGTVSVTVTGTQFIDGVTSIGLGPDLTVTSFSVRSSTELQANVSAGSTDNAGVRDVSVTNSGPGGGTATLSGGFTVSNPAPTIVSISPTNAGRGSLVNVVLTGTQFINGVTTVIFGPDITVTSTIVKNASELQMSISVGATAATGARAVSVTNASPGGGTAILASGFNVTTSPATGIEGELGVIPDHYVLQEAYPNPFNPSTRVRYGIPENSRVELIVHNMLGNVVAQLISGERSKGLYELLWHAENLPSGVYLIRFHAESLESAKRFIASRKVVLVK